MFFTSVHQVLKLYQTIFRVEFENRRVREELGRYAHLIVDDEVFQMWFLDDSIKWANKQKKRRDGLTSLFLLFSFFFFQERRTFEPAPLSGITTSAFFFSVLQGKSDYEYE